MMTDEVPAICRRLPHLGPSLIIGVGMLSVAPGAMDDVAAIVGIFQIRFVTEFRQQFDQVQALEITSEFGVPGRGFPSTLWCSARLVPQI